MYYCTTCRCFGVPDIYLLLSGFVAEIQTLAIRQVLDIEQHPTEDGTLNYLPEDRFGLLVSFMSFLPRTPVIDSVWMILISEGN